MSVLSPSCLIVEDDPALNSALSRYLKRSATVDQATNLSAAYQFVADRDVGYDVILVDRHLPDGDGVELVSYVQKHFPNTRICVLTGLTSEKEQQLALQTGADICLNKPLSAQCVRTHIQALLRRGKVSHDHTFHWRDLALQTNTNTLVRSQQMISLTRRETQCLALFFSSGDGEVSREELLQIFWHPQRTSSIGVLHVNIQRLRKKLHLMGVHIRASYGAGYQLHMMHSL